MLSFAVYARAVNKAIKETEERIVNLLLGCIYKPLDLRMKNGEKFYIDKTVANRFLNADPKRPIHNEIVSSSGESAVVNSAVSYFSENIRSLIIHAMQADMIDSLAKIIQFDVTISENKRAELLALAKEETLAEFLASTFLYAVNKPNIVLEKITEHNNLPEQNKYFSGRADHLESINDLFKGKENKAVSICQTFRGLAVSVKLS